MPTGFLLRQTECGNNNRFCVEGQEAFNAIQQYVLSVVPTSGPMNCSIQMTHVASMPKWQPCQAGERICQALSAQGEQTLLPL